MIYQVLMFLYVLYLYSQVQKALLLDIYYHIQLIQQAFLKIKSDCFYHKSLVLLYRFCR